jgi:hypothetical protein
MEQTPRGKKIFLYDLKEVVQQLDEEIYFLKFCHAQEESKIQTIDKLLVKDPFKAKNSL